MKLLYLANARVPSEKANALQIVQNCEAFAEAGAEVTLWAARRFNPPALRGVRDVWAHYGVRRCFRLRRLPCLDLMPLVPGRSDWPARLIFYLQYATFILSALVGLAFTRADLIYSRDEQTLLVLSLFKPRRRLVYEAHQRAQGRLGRWLQRQVVRRAGTIVTVTARLAVDLTALGADPGRVLVAHDGVRRARFAGLPDRAAARAALGWPPGSFIIGYVGQLRTMGMDKGAAALVEAAARLEGAALALVGGPAAAAEALRARWLALGRPADRFVYAGQVAPERVPLHLAALDVGVLPFPWTEHFAYYASPLKLFEYMAAGCAVVASDLPSLAEVVEDGETALLTPPGDVAALAAALRRLQADPALTARLAANAQARALAAYTWDARARAILDRAAAALNRPTGTSG